MDPADLKTLIPPSLLGIGGLIPILIGQNPFTITDRLKPILGALFVILVWMAYLAAILLYRWLFFSQWLALLFLVVALACFGFLLRGPLFPQGAADNGTTPGEAQRNFLLYCGGIVAVTIAATTMTAGKDWVVMDISFEPAASSGIQSVQLVPGEGNMTPWKHPASAPFWCGSGCRIVMAKNEHESPNWQIVWIATQDGKSFQVSKSELRALLQPGGANQFEGEAKLKTTPKS